MSIQIKEIILWPRVVSVEPRRVSFEIGKVNVISGRARTGKSALIPIIDYCLGARECRIPVGPIRESCSWFGVLLVTSQGQKLFARREPGHQKSTGEMFIQEGKEICVPKTISRGESTVETAKRILDELAGLTSLDFYTDDADVGFRGRPSFRDLVSFVFQPQNIIANANVLFYKSDSYKHREKLRIIFPYVLGAVTSSTLVAKHELEDLRRELRRKEGELTTLQQVSERWQAEVRSQVESARELGLVRDPIPLEATKDKLVSILVGVTKLSSEDAQVTDDTIKEAVDELRRLQREESQISLRLSAARKRYSEMAALKSNLKEYHGALMIQRDRLAISEWLSQTYDPEHNCPICGNTLAQTSKEVNDLLDSLKDIEAKAGDAGSVPAAFDREFDRVRIELRTLAEKLQGLAIRRQALERRSTEAKKSHYDSLRISRFIGNIEESIRTYERLGSGSELAEEIEALRERVRVLQNEVAEVRIKRMIDRAISAVNLNAGKVIAGLDCERPRDPIRFSINDLNIKVLGVQREDYLWEIGSGSNWLAYHIAVSLGLHQYFLSLKENPVPSFLIYDQPSQVYFPQLLGSSFKDEKEERHWKDEDLEAVRRLFAVLGSAVNASKRSLQVIVLDHAPESTWEGLEGILLIEDWSKGRKLIPEEWITKL